MARCYTPRSAPCVAIIREASSSADGNPQPDITTQRERLQNTVLDGSSPSDPSPQSSRNPVEEEAERVHIRARGGGANPENKALEISLSNAHTNSQSAPGPLHVHYSFQFSTFMGLLNL